jgi:hypothetical protein
MLSKKEHFRDQGSVRRAIAVEAFYGRRKDCRGHKQRRNTFRGSDPVFGFELRKGNAEFRGSDPVFGFELRKSSGGQIRFSVLS